MKTSLSRFVFGVIVSLPLSFIVWYFAAPILNIPLTWLLDTAMPGLWPELIDSVQTKGHRLEILTHYSPPLPPGVVAPPGQQPLFAFYINPLIYGYSLPFLAALGLAVPGQDMGDAFSALLFAWLLALLPLQAFGCGFAIWQVMLHQIQPDFIAHAISDWGREFIGLGYQFSTLMLPLIAPVGLWILYYRDYLRRLAPALV